MDFHYWLKDPANAPLYRYGQGWDKGEIPLGLIDAAMDHGDAIERQLELLMDPNSGGKKPSVPRQLGKEGAAIDPKDKAAIDAFDAKANKWVSEQPEEDRRRLVKQIETEFKLERSDPFVRELMNTSDPEERAELLWDAYRKMSKEEQDKIYKQGMDVGGIFSDRFYKRWKELKAESAR